MSKLPAPRYRDQTDHQKALYQTAYDLAQAYNGSEVAYGQFMGAAIAVDAAGVKADAV